MINFVSSGQNQLIYNLVELAFLIEYQFLCYILVNKTLMEMIFQMDSNLVMLTGSGNLKKLYIYNFKLNLHHAWIERKNKLIPTDFT